MPHRDDALVAQREHRQVDEDRQHDDRPAVVADVAVDPLQRAKQRHDQPREDAEVDRAHEIAIDRREHVEVLRARGRTARSAAPAWYRDRPVDEMRDRVRRRAPARRAARYCTRTGWPPRQCGGTGSSDRRRRRTRTCLPGRRSSAISSVRDAAHAPVAIEDRLRRRAVDVPMLDDEAAADSGAPVDGRHELAPALRDRRGERDDVRGVWAKT